MKQSPGTTSADVAAWMSAQFRRGDGYLDHSEAAFGVEALFGEPFGKANDTGTVSIARTVLRTFRKLTPLAVWDAVDRAWHRRDHGDGS